MLLKSTVKAGPSILNMLQKNKFEKSENVKKLLATVLVLAVICGIREKYLPNSAK